MKLALRTLVISVLTVAAATAFASPAGAAFGFKDLDVTFTDENGSAITQAGAHPFAFTTSFGVNTFVNGEGSEVPEGEAKTLILRQVPGLAGSPEATPKCKSSEFADLSLGRSACPDSSAVGIADVRAGFEPPPPTPNGALPLHLPVFNLVAPPGVAARFGFIVLNVPVVIDVGVSQEPPHEIVARVENIPQILLFYSSSVTLWGNPADPAHDPVRGSCLSVEGVSEQPVSTGLCPVSIPERPFLTLPRSCKGPLATTLRSNSWEEPGVFVTDTALTHDDSEPPNPQGLTGCEKLAFSPDIEARPTTAAAESPAGLRFSLLVDDPGLSSTKGLAGSDIEKVEATLPEGVTVNPSAAEGLGVCTPAQYDAASLIVQGCPASSKLGAVTVKTPLLEKPLEGSLYLAQQDDPSSPGAENPFDSLIALYVIIRSPQYGIFIGQAGKVEPDPRTGRLVSTFDGIPELPFSELQLRFREGPRSPLVTPPTCGTYETVAKLTPHSGTAPVFASSSFEIDSGPGGGPCPSAGVLPFAPGFEAGSINNNAGSYSPFFMRLTRRDGEQDMTRFDSILPPGVTGKIAGVARCPDFAIAAAAGKTGREELAAPSCPAASQIGHVLAGAGVGPQLTYVPGKVYLAGPYVGAPLSVVVVTPAVAGPFDAGTVVVREALKLNPTTAEVEVDGAASDPIPHILKGIPLKLRDLRVHIDRDKFILNPTSCDPSQVRATLFGSFADVFSPADDVPAALTARYQAANCATLGFKPRLSIRLKGGTKRNRYPALKAVLTPRPGDANVGRAAVTLPRSAFLEQGHIRTICTRVQFAAKACPAGSIYGKATAWTPLLDEPLTGPVYLRSSDNPLPDLVASLHGTVDFELAGRIDSKGGGIRTTFATPPDAPVSRFVLEMQGGKKGLIVNSRDLCIAKSRADADFTGQNGKRYHFRPVVKAQCGGKKSGRAR